MSGPTKKQLRARAVEILERFKYKPMTVDEFASELDAWRCKEPGTTSYAFDIMITRFGISVMGDIGNLTFRVGVSYGMAFLAGNDVDYYIHSKLDSALYEKVDFDGDRFMEGVAHRLADALYDELDGNVPHWMSHNEYTPGKLYGWLAEQPKKLATTKHHFVKIYDQAARVGTVEDAVGFLQGSDLFDDPESWPSYTMPSAAIRQELYIVNEAARRIMTQAPDRYKD